MKIDVTVGERAEIGIGRALLQLKTDTITQRPTAPIREGFLRGSASIHVQKRELPVPLGPGERSDKKVFGFQIPLQDKKIIGLIGFNVPYASRTHEVPMHFSDPEAGNKYLESKMANNKMIYKKIIVNAINEEAKK
jgi:hypothetical protein